MKGINAREYEKPLREGQIKGGRARRVDKRGKYMLRKERG